MSDQNLWSKITKPVQLQKEPILAEGYFNKRNNNTNNKRYFRLYDNFIYYFDVKKLFYVIFLTLQLINSNSLKNYFD